MYTDWWKELSHCGLMGKRPLSGRENWSKCKNISICTKKALIVTQYYAIFPLHPKFPNIFSGDNSFYACSSLVSLYPPPKSMHQDSVVLLPIFASFAYIFLLTFPYDYTLFGFHF